jgi:hypothetical protein
MCPKGARYEFPRSFDRRLPLSDAFATGWETVRTDKGEFDYACPDCLTVDRSPRTIADDPPRPRNEPRQVEGVTKPAPPPQSVWRKPTEPVRNRRRRRNRGP